MSATPYSCVLGFFFPLIHISDSRRGTLKSAAHPGWSSCPHSWGVTLLGFTVFHLLFLWAFHSGMSTHPSWQLCLPSSVCHTVIHGGLGGRLGLRQTWTAEWPGRSCWFIHSHPVPQQWQWVPRVPPPALQEGGRAVMGHFLGSTSVQERSSTAPVEVTRGTGGGWGQPPWNKRVSSGSWGQNWYQYLQKLGEKEGECRMWEKLRGRDNLQD